MSALVTTDIAIVGAGISGLWMANVLKNAGYQVVVLESHCIGGVQTLASQGIIHGGTKYALKGTVTESAQAIARMPKVWKACLEGRGVLDLRNVRVNSDRHYLWTKGRFSGAIKGLVSRHLLNSDSHTLSPKEYPDLFKNQKLSGSVCALNEVVLDVKSLIQALVSALNISGSISEKISPILRVNNTLALENISSVSSELLSQDHPNETRFDLTWQMDHQSYRLRAQKIILAAGAGNQSLLEALSSHKGSYPKMQTRPLKMVWIRFHASYQSAFCHVVASGSTPVLTITTHQDEQGRSVWYLGGGLAESGIARSDEAQVDCAKALMQEHFPWVSLSQTDWGVYSVSRAEPWSETGVRPESFYAHTQNNLMITWPTKLTLVPAMAEWVLKNLEKSALEKSECSDQSLFQFAQSSSPLNMGVYPWESILRSQVLLEGCNRGV